jgi:beta-phosphoglucomutase
MSSHTFCAALFDLDGVVVFTDRYHYLAWKRLADDKGWAFDESVNEGCKGVPRMASLEVILRHNGIDLSEEEKQSLADRKNSDYVAGLGAISDDDIVPGARPFLERLHAEHLPLALCSSSRNARMVLQALQLDRLFSATVTGHDIARPKPDPEIFLRGAELLGVEPADCVVFEDAASGVAAALAAGMRCIGVGSPESLPEAEACIRNFLDPRLDDILAELGARTR